MAQLGAAFALNRRRASICSTGLSRQIAGSMTLKTRYQHSTVKLNMRSHSSLVQRDNGLNSGWY